MNVASSYPSLLRILHIFRCLCACSYFEVVEECSTSCVLQGMVMVSPKMNPTICCQFEAAIVLLFHAKTFRRGSQVTVHVGNVRQTATVECLHGKVGEFSYLCYIWKQTVNPSSLLVLGRASNWREGRCSLSLHQAP